MNERSYKYKIVVTDHNFADLEIEKMKSKNINAELVDGQCEWNNEEAIILATQDAHAVINQNAIITRKVIESLQKCRVIMPYGVGLDCIDVKAATQHGIIVANVPDYCLNEVADHTMALMLSCLRKVTQETITIKRKTEGRIYGVPLFKPIFKLRKQTLGLIGFGNVAQNLVPKARVFGFEIIAYDPFIDEEKFKEYKVRQVSLDELLKISDVVSLHLGLSKETEGLIAEKEFRMMKSTAFLINTSRGRIIDEKALYTALKKGWIGGAGIDVTIGEPIRSDDPLLKFDNLVITNHIGHYSEGSVEDVRTKAIEETIRVLTKGLPRPIAFVNPQVKQKIN